MKSSLTITTRNTLYFLSDASSKNLMLRRRQVKSGASETLPSSVVFIDSFKSGNAIGGIVVLLGLDSNGTIGRPEPLLDPLRTLRLLAIPPSLDLNVSFSGLNIILIQTTFFNFSDLKIIQFSGS